MKLKTKFQDEYFELGEIVEATIMYGCNDRIHVMTDMHHYYYDSIKELTDDWEDYKKEDKMYWWIDSFGFVNHSYFCDDWMDEGRKEIGNYFETEKEAEKAVQKLKAFRRLRDKGFRFDGYDVAHNSNGNLCGQAFYNAGNYSIQDIEHELDICFGGEE